MHREHSSGSEMGRPRHYSAEVPVRCQALIDMLSRRVEEDSDPDGQWGGPLKTTFLIAMATPMLVLPIERIFKPAGGNHHGVADDRDLDSKLADLVIAQFGVGRTFGAAPFFEPGQWAYVPETDPFNVARDWPRDALDALGSHEASEGAALAPTAQVLLALRNALAHGGVTYLDRDGRHTAFATNMLGFASFARFRRPELQLLRISVQSFENFLRLWAAWLASSGVLNQIEDRGPGYFDYAAE